MAMPRRTSTLEPLSSNAVNRRSLLGGPARNGSRPSLGPGYGDAGVVKRTSQGGRLSLFGAPMGTSIAKRPSTGRPSNPMSASVAGGVRRSTAYSHVRQDPRPNTDKAYIQASIRALINYLTEHNYDHPFSPKILSRPTARDFTYIISFLFRQVDPHFKMVGKLEEEVIGFFKALHYPFQISKASLSAVGTMHTWPTLLASITWLIELLTYDEEVQNNKQQSDEEVDEREDQRLFYEYLGKAYKAFLDGNDEQESQLDAALVSTFDDRDVHVEKQCEQAEARLNKLRQQIQECHDRKVTLPALQEKHADYVSDLGKFRTHLEQVQSHRDAMAAKVSKRQQELQQLEKQLQEVLQETAQLREVVANQELSPEEAQRMIQERERLQEAMTKASKHNGEMKKALWEAEMELSRAVENLQTAAGTFNSKAAELQLIPLSARNSNGIEYEMVVHKNAISETADTQTLVGVDIRNTIRPSLASLKNIVIEQHHKARKEVLRLLDEQARSEEELSEVLQQLTSLEGKAKKQEEMYRAEKAALEASMADKSEEVDRVESQVMHLRSQVVAELEAKLAKNHQKLAQFTTDMQIEREQHASDVQSILEAIMNTLTLCADHKEHVKRRLGELKELYVQKRDLLLAEGEPALMA